MFHESHETFIDCLKRHLKAWKLRGPSGDGKEGAYSDQTICDEIVKTFERLGGSLKTGMRFSSTSKDEFNRLKANAVRISRMMNDEVETDEQFTSDSLFNLLPYITAAMPRDLSHSFWLEYQAVAGFAPQSLDDAGDGELTIRDLSLVIKADSDSHQAFAAVLQNPNDAAALAEARKTLRMAIAEKVRRSKTIEALIRVRAATGAAIGRIVHRKDKVMP